MDPSDNEGLTLPKTKTCFCGQQGNKRDVVIHLRVLTSDWTEFFNETFPSVVPTHDESFVLPTIYFHFGGLVWLFPADRIIISFVFHLLRQQISLGQDHYIINCNITNNLACLKVKCLR